MGRKVELGDEKRPDHIQEVNVVLFGILVHASDQVYAPLTAYVIGDIHDKERAAQ